jgi:hypothetical protein
MDHVGAPTIKLSAQCARDYSSSSIIWDCARRYRRNGYHILQVFDSHQGRYHTIFEHVLIWERVHGRRVPVNCYIHHRDLDRSNNRSENLMCIPKGLHQELHARLHKARQAISTLQFEVVRHRITQEYEQKAAELQDLWDLIHEARSE